MNDAPSVIKPPKYCVCVDAREESRLALKLACLKARARGGNVDLLHVILPADFQTLGGIADRMREERHAEGEQLLQRFITEAQTFYGITPGTILREGIVGDEIIAATNQDTDIAMLILGVAQQGTGQGKLTTWLSVQVGGKLAIPVLMVPGNLTDQQLQSLV